MPEDPRNEDELWWPELKPTEQHCETCGTWLGYNYPALYCRECQPTKEVT
jgi:hypothetical protein